MALFKKGKEERAEAENQIMQKLSQCEYLSALMNEILKQAGKLETVINKETGERGFLEENLWLTECQDYYDSRTRKVVIEPDGFIIKWGKTRTEEYQGADGKVHTRSVEDAISHIGYAYTKDGYRPLHGVSVGDVQISRADVVLLWTKIIRERMISLFPELKFADVTQLNDTAYFTYKVPELEWKDWF